MFNKIIKKSFEKEISTKELKEVKTFKTMVWCAFWFYVIVLLGAFLSAYNDNNDGAAPQTFDFNKIYVSETQVAVYTLFYKHSDGIAHKGINKGYLALYVLILVGTTLSAFRSAIKFLGTFDKPKFHISLRSAKYLTNLSDAIIGYFLALILTGQVYETLYKWSPEVINFDYTQLGNAPLVILLIGGFMRIVATLLKRSAELQDEVDATV